MTDTAYKIIDHSYDAVIVGAGGSGLRAVMESAQNGLKTACILTGGVFRRVYEVANTIVTSAGRTHVQTITFRIGPVEAV